MSKLYYLGHASVRIETNQGIVIYIDPYAEGDYSKPADIILQTHDHFDHNELSKVTKKDTCKIITQEQALVNGKYQKFSMFGVEIEAVEAYNKNHKIDESVGYILTFDGLKLYHMGDTSTTQRMHELREENLDYVLLPTDGVYNMGPQEASECADLIAARYNIAFHTSPAPEGFSQETVDQFQAKGKLVLRPMKTIELLSRNER